MRFPRRAAILLCCVSALIVGCDKKSRTKNSAGSSSLTAELETTPLPVYRFVTAEQTLTDARQAFSGEKWSEAQAAAEALLDKQPEHAEALRIRDQAKLEAQSQLGFNTFNKAAASTDAAAMAKAWRNISDSSVYKERARPQFEKVKARFVDSQEAETDRLVRLGRCDEAKRLARTAGDYFPDVRERLEAIPIGCRPARDEKPARTELASIDRRTPDKAEAPAAMEPVPVPEPQPAALTLKPTTTATVEPPRTVIPPPPAPPAPLAPATPVKLAPTELETLRIAGERLPALAPGAKGIAHRDGVKRIDMAAQLCVSENGVPSSVKLLRSSEYNDANDKIVADIKQWRFRPHFVDGRPTPVCSAILLRYTIE